MAEEQTITQQQQTPQIKQTRDYRRALRTYEKKRQRYAIGKQSDAQVAETTRHTQQLAKLSAQMGAAVNDPQKKAELQQAYLDEENLHKTNMEATADLQQYYSDFNEEAYDKEQAEKQQKETEQSSQQAEKQGQSSSSVNQQTQSSKTTTQSKDIKDSNDENSGFLSSGVSSAAVNSLSNYFMSKTPNGTPKAPNSERMRNQAEMHDKQAGDEQKNAQQNFQVANRDYRVEAEKNAASQAAAENAQKVHNLGSASAGAAALERDVKSADYNTHMQRQDQQRAEGVKNQREMWGARQTAEEERADADKEDYDYLDNQVYNNAATSLAIGGASDNGSSSASTKQQSQTTNNDNGQPTETEENTEQEATEIKGSPQRILNYVTYAKSDPQGHPESAKPLTGDDLALYQAWGSPAPLEPSELTNGAQSVATTPRLKDFWQKYISANPNGRMTGGQKNAGEAGQTVEAINKATTTVQRGGTNSDARQKNIIAALGSIRF